ncbi:eukaryotic aspartyl protease domain-containing protein [Sarocladium implicatum]|nr:eukaryotic aspartyl protease domain-containing protein [Sarocladium implicatum]
MRPTKLVTFAAIFGSAYSALAPLHRRAKEKDSRKDLLPITATLNSYWFDVEVEVGNQTFYLVVDTGSSDTWVAATGYTCIDVDTNQVTSSDECMWSPTYNIQPSTQFVHNQTFGVKYGTGIALGQIAYESVKLGGITVPKQKIGVVDRTNDKGDGINSGILGLGFPALTSAHPGTELKNDSISLITNREIYDPLFVNMYESKLVDSWYSIAIDRLPRDTATGKAGWLGLGQLPPVSHSDNWTSAPIEITKGIPDAFYENGKPEISLMTLTVESISWGSSLASTTTNTTTFQAVIDSGNPQNMVPMVAAQSINSMFDPPATFDEDSEVFLVDCDAKAPLFGVTINGHTFWHQPEDMISQDHDTGACYSSVAGSSEGFGFEANFLGDAFLKNVIAVFDFGKTEMRFASRTEGEETNPTPLTSDATRSLITASSFWLFGILASLA